MRRKSVDALESQDSETLRHLRSEIDEFRREEVRLLEEIARQYPDYAALTQPQPVTIESLQRDVLHPRELLVEYFLTPNRVAIFAISHDRFVAASFQAPVEATLLPVLMLRDSITHPEDWHPELEHDLYGRLLRPIEAQLAEKETVYVAPDGVLHYLPWEILSLGEKPGLLLDASFSVSYVPSASVLESIRKRKKPRDRFDDLRRPLLVFGDPIVPPAGDRSIPLGSGEALLDLLGEKGPCSDLLFSPLRYAEAEARALAGLYGLDPAGPEVNLRERATEARLRALDLKKYRYLHFATHGILCDEGEESWLQSSLLFSLSRTGVLDRSPDDDGVLQVEEIFGLSLDADLVTLSACQTGLGSDVAGEGLVGLARSFLYAGTPSVLVSLWSVDDQSTSLFMKHFYRSLERGLTKGAALRETKRWMRDESYDVDQYGNLIRHDHPFFWAPFILIGDQD